MLSTTPRSTSTRTSSGRVQWLKCSGGGSQASANNRQICSAVKRPGQPGRGLSASSSPTASRNRTGFPDRFANSAPPRAQRPRHIPTVSSFNPSFLPIALLAYPRLANSTIRLRCTKLCGASRLRLMACRRVFSSGVRVICGAGRAIIVLIVFGEGQQLSALFRAVGTSTPHLKYAG